MISLVLMVALVAFAAGATAAVFLMLCIAIRRGDRPERILGNRNASLDASARAVLDSRTGRTCPSTAPASKTTDREAPAANSRDKRGEPI